MSLLFARFRELRIVTGTSRRSVRSLLVCVLIVSISLPGLASFRVTAQDGGAGDVPVFRGNPARTVSIGRVAPEAGPW